MADFQQDLELLQKFHSIGAKDKAQAIADKLWANPEYVKFRESEDRINKRAAERAENSRIAKDGNFIGGGHTTQLLQDGFTLGLSGPLAGVHEVVTGEIGELFGGDEMSISERYQAGERSQDLSIADAKEKAGGVGTAAQITGAIASGSIFKNPAMLSSPLMRTAQAAGEGAAITGVDSLARARGDVGDRLMEAGKDALIGGFVSGGITRGLDKGATMLNNRAFRKAAPKADALKKQADEAYKFVKDAPVGISGDDVTRITRKAVQNLSDEAFMPSTAPGAYRMVQDFFEDYQRFGHMPIGRLESYRQRIAAVARQVDGGGSSTPDAVAAQKVLKAFDDALDNVDGIRFEAIGGGDKISGPGQINNAREAVKTARKNWRLYKKTDILEEAIRKGTDAKSGTQNGIKNELLKIVKNRKYQKIFSPDELAMIREVATGNMSDNLLHAAGKLSGSGGAGANITGPALLYLMTDGLGLLGMGAAFGGAMGARTMGTRNTQAGADLARAMAATGSKPGVVGANPALSKIGATTPNAIGNLNSRPARLP